jgi:hypothetical protein
MAANLMAPLPPEIIRQRLASLLGYVVGALADYERGLLGNAANRPSRAVYLGNLVDAINGLLTQPISEETARALELVDAAESTDSGERDPSVG